MFSKVAALSRYTGRSVYTNGLGYDRFYPWKRKGEHPDTLMQFICDVGIPRISISDRAPEVQARKTCQKYPISMKATVPHIPCQNAAEASIRELKQSVRRTLQYAKAQPFDD
jgi:hypothetical protein